MKKFNITVNGKSYEVEVEELGGAAASAPRPAAPRPAAPAAPAPKPAAAPAPKPAAAPAAPAAAPAGGHNVDAPMPGTLLDIKVNVGDAVTSGQVLMILEAMKMENEIMAPADGRVAAINVNKGASVNAGEVLIVLE